MSNMTERNMGFTGALSKCTLAEGTNANTIQLTAALDFAINGIIYNKAITNNIAMTALPVQAVSTACAYLVQIDSAGTVSMKKGAELSAADYALANSTVEPPKADADRCPVGIIKIVTNNSTTFTSGSTDLSTAGLTVTYRDVCGIPGTRL